MPVLLPDGSVPETVHQHKLDVRLGYDPWIHRVVLQSLPPGAVALDLGAGNLALDLPNLIRMDVTLTPYVDVVGDAHALPFLPGTFDFMFSLAVIEHLRQPFVAAQEMHQALRDGGYVYGECNFVFAYHGYPHHYFNASQQGLEQVFQAFTKLRSGVAPYQMPSFALRMLLLTYLQHFPPSDAPEIIAFHRALQNILDQPLSTYDGFLTEEQALQTAAGVFFFGYKAVSESAVIPQPLQEAWAASPALQARFPQLYDLGHADNILRWSKGEGCAGDPSIAALWERAIPFQKADRVMTDAVATFESWPVIEPVYSNIPDQARNGLFDPQAEAIQRATAPLEQQIAEKNEHIARLESLLRRVESGRVMRLLRWLTP
ncbi:MAG TPA: class I SAM-dependent methyltransferase [Roseiflexaceae bacterium]|nr:class I SAM-dependent methyltransferase [Roseiflexaceae bacterium]